MCGSCVEVRCQQAVQAGTGSLDAHLERRDANAGEGRDLFVAQFFGEAEDDSFALFRAELAKRMLEFGTSVDGVAAR